MASMQLSDADIPSCAGKTVVITGGSSGIGWATGKIFASHGARVFLLDVRAPQEGLPLNSQYIECDITKWADILAAFEIAGDVIDILVANAGVSEEVNYFEDTFDSEGKLVEPGYNVIEVNLRGTINVIKVGLSIMRLRKTAGSIVITTPWQLIGLMRALRATLPLDNITINTVAPAATLTGLIPPELAKPIIAMGLPTSSADFVGLAVAYSAVALETRQVELYGKDPDTATVECKGRWNGRTILTLGDRYTELEQAISDLRPQWFGVDNATLTRMQQKATDFR
ncbi:short chain dehydrogenase/ reductase [Aspergillus flavus]|uniref:Short chain dehydrogenase/ reductase n=1 Tax=Aspergillus flavus (strain ATCC 200026 / FGSC A1120 / IAM 13836 / NRRL 3357 / JCM 12722 / SRRC 167) TaxID=332952 RepID=A0A7U2R1Q4_ASPFN|nr:short chain dehydrogenase/ reductase [Aspergillus flavus]